MTEIDSAAIGLAFYREVSELFPGVKVQFPGFSADQANDKDKEWMGAYLINTSPTRTREPRKLKKGIFQVSCFARFSKRAANNEHDRPYKLASMATKHFERKNFRINNYQGEKEIIGSLTVFDGSEVYLDESEIAKSQVKGFIDPANVHAVIISFNFQASAF